MHLSVENNEGKFQQAVIYQIQASFLLGKFTSGHLYMQACRCTHSDLKVEIGKSKTSFVFYMSHLTCIGNCFRKHILFFSK